MKIILVGLNYKSHAEELEMAIPDEPVIFMKPDTAVIGSGEKIVLPKGVGRVDYEGEIAVVIGKECKSVSPSDVKDVVIGITALNDVTARDIQKKDGQWIRAKSFDTFCPVNLRRLLPYKGSEEITVKTFLNGRMVQCGSSLDMIFPIDFLVSFVSNVMTLKEGDIISTGTPPGIGNLRSGDKVAIEVSLKEFVTSVENSVS